MITHQEVSLLTNYTAREGVAISFYLNTDGSERSKTVWDIETKDLLKKAHKEIQSLPINRKHIEAGDETLRRIQSFVAQEDPALRCKSIAVFANSVENFYQVYRLPVSTKSDLVIDTNFYLRPLLAMLEEHCRIGVVLVDSKHARLFESYMGEIVEHQDFAARTKAPRKPLMETFMKREKKLMQRKEEDTRFHISTVADILKTHFALRHFDKLMIGARKPIGDHLARLLHRRLRDSLICTFEIDIHASERDILGKIFSAERDYEIEEQKKFLRKISNEIERDGYAVKGMKAVIEAIHDYNIHSLAVSDEYSRAGLVCSQCGMPHLEGDTCTCCGETLVQVSDMVYDIVEEATRQGASVKHIQGESLIRSLENIAALIKFKKGELVLSEEAVETEA